MTTFPRSLVRILALLLTTLVALFAVNPIQAQTTKVGIHIQVDEDAAEVIRAWRRANGLDPPDAVADARVREILAARTAKRVEAERRAMAIAASATCSDQTPCVATTDSL
ncbi:hypothetical protein [Tahibacter amnicola]|uniref:Secreted protein n=1 Tax=Tahibacter amnicola TaxID=2976241 RepID=A0ABY6BG19_9GAMM|nr:hypothetical protein [Tahibacter amnicola]UXI67315.1 hypothetical protein N4264_21635 [Tahibacter amnicola]